MLTELTVHGVNRGGDHAAAGGGRHRVTMDYPAPGAESEELAGGTPITSSCRIAED